MNGITAKILIACAGLLAASGCITISPAASPLSLKSLTTPKIEKAVYEEKVESAPPDPQHPEQLKLAYAKVMEEGGHFDEAQRQYTAVLDRQPQNVDAILGLARLNQAAGNSTAAEEGFRQAVTIAPNSAAAQFCLGQYFAGQKRWDAAAQALTKAMLAAPYDSQTRFALAVALTHRGDVESALPQFIRTVGDAEAHYNVALILYDEGRLAESERHFTIALTKKPNLAPAREWLAYLQSQGGQGRPATDVLRDPQSNRVVPADHSVAAAPAPQSPSARDTVAAAPSSRNLSSRQLEQLANQVSPRTTR